MMLALFLAAVVLLAANIAVLLLRRRRRILATWALEEAEAEWPAHLADEPPRPPRQLRANYAPIGPGAPWASPAADIRGDLMRAAAAGREASYAPTEHWCLYCSSVCTGDLAYWQHLERDHPEVLESFRAAADPDGGRRGD